MKRSAIRHLLLAATAVSATAIAACGGATNQATTEGGSATETAAAGGSGLSGAVMVDGSSTVFPISEGMAEEFMKANPDVRVTVGVSGTGGGFKKFCAGETDMSNASRPIKQSEIDLCKQNGIEYVELPVAFDGLSVVVNKENTWAACLKPDELKKMWETAAEGTVTSWRQIRPDFPDQKLGLYGPGTDSGTYDYFTDAINGTEGESRGDFTASEDDNVLVQGVEADPNSLGFFGFAYYEENADRLKLVEIENSAGQCVAPNAQTIADGSYNPLARAIFVYFSKKSLEEKPAVKAFAEYHLDPANGNLVTETGYVPMPADINTKAQARLQNLTVGTVFNGESSVGVKLADKL
ncbi:MAG: PstS family phosphate ABC transporter substrate-binding protein [Cyanophyceae cyanobacterium]